MSEFYTKLNLEKVEKIVADCMLANGYENSDLGDGELYCDGYEMDECFDCRESIGANGYLVKKEDSHGGYEGGGDETWNVYSIKNTNTGVIEAHFKINGYYNSWEGTEWDDHLILVKPITVEVIQWEDT